jgi:hypothetical protein
MKELYLTSPYRRSLRTIRLEYGQVKKKFVLEPLRGISTVEGYLKVLQVKKYLRMNRNF